MMAKRTKAGEERAAGAASGPVKEAARLIAEAARLLRSVESPGDVAEVAGYTAGRLDSMIYWLEEIDGQQGERISSADGAEAGGQG